MSGPEIAQPKASAERRARRLPDTFRKPGEVTEESKEQSKEESKEESKGGVLHSEYGFDAILNKAWRSEAIEGDED